MPKPKPHQIIRHELVLGRSERELLDTLVTANAANRVITPVVSLLSDPSALAALFLILESTGIIDIIPNELREGIESGLYKTVEEAEDAWKTIQEIKNDVENANRIAAGLAPLAPIPMPIGVRFGIALLQAKKLLG